MKRFLASLFLLGSIFLSSFLLPVYAADIRSGDNLSIDESQRLKNAYLFGKDVRSKAVVTDDIVAAGGNITLEGRATGSIIVAGGDITVDSRVGNSVRAAGGDIVINGPVTNDVVVFGGTVTVTKSASIGGDLIFAGGNLRVEGPVRGKILMNGGSVVLSSKVGGNVEGDIGTLQLKNGAEIGGNLNYTSSQKALISDGAIVHGQTTYHISPEKKNKNALTEFIAAGTFLKLITDILFSLLLLYLFPGIIKRIYNSTRNLTVKSGLTGLGIFVITPIVALFLLLLPWLGISVWLLYFLSLVMALMLAKLLTGLYVMSWWRKRNKAKYELDWKAAVIGPIIIAILFLIPIIGWLIVVIIYFVTLGSLFLMSLDLRTVSVKK